MGTIVRINNENDLDELMKSKRAVIFKHSTRCPISASAKHQVEQFCRTCSPEITVYLVDVIADRAISSAVEARTGVMHHSPEVIFIRDGAVTGHLTHWDIQSDTLARELTE